MKKYALLFFALLITSLSFSQKKQTAQQSLVLFKEHLVFLRMAEASPCRNKKLIQQLSDSLLMEGFEVIDSTRAFGKLNDFFNHTFGYSHRNNYTKTLEEVKAYYDREFTTAKLYQDLAIYDYSCLDTLHNYTISLYMAPRAKDVISQNFTLSFKSQYAIPAIILSLIERKNETSKK